MRQITKGEAPSSLKKFKAKNPDKNYSFLQGDEYASIRREIRKVCLNEQYYICAYCCTALASVDNCHNEHIVPKDTHQGANKSLDFNNIVASCNSKKHCGHYKKNNIMPVSPLDSACESEFEFLLSGQVDGLTDNAKKTVSILNLNHQSLVMQRRLIIETFIMTWEEDFKDIEIENEELMLEIIREQEQNNKMEQFFPVTKSFIYSYYNLNN